MTLPWPGDKIEAADWGVVTSTDPGLGGDLWNLDATDTAGLTASVVAGDEFLFFAWHANTLLPGDSIDNANWAMKVQSGTATFELYEAADPDYLYSSTLGDYTWVPKGTVSVTGPDRVVAPLSPAYKTYDWLTENNGVLVFRVKVTSGSAVLEELTLQAEPSTGLQEVTGYTWSSPATPPEIKRNPTINVASKFYSGTHTETIYSQFNPNVGSFTGPWLAYFPPDYPAILAAAFSAIGFTTSSGTTTAMRAVATCRSQAQVSSTNLPPPWSPTNPDTTWHFDARGIVTKTETDVTAVWTTYPTLRELPSDWDKVDGRDYTTFGDSGFLSYIQWEAGVDTEALGWTPGYVVPEIQYREQGFTRNASTGVAGPAINTVAGASPHGDSASVGGVIADTSTGAGATGALDADQVWDPPPELIGPVTPTAGTNFSLDATGPTAALTATPNSEEWGDGFTRDTGGVTDVESTYYWWWAELRPDGKYSRVRPSIRLQMPDYQYKVPIFSLSADALLSDGLPSTSSGSAGEYPYEYVTAGPPPPVLWFAYKRWGFDGDVFEVWGIGLGNTQASLNGKLYISVDTTLVVGDDTLLPVTSWTYHAPTAAAYDGTGVIFPGSDFAPPVVDPEAQKLVFTIPAGTTLDVPHSFNLYVVNDNGTSNSVPVLLYPMIDIEMQSADPTLLSIASSMGIHDRPAADDRLEQRYSSFTLPPYVVSGKVPEREPQYLVNAAGAFSLTGGTATTELDDPVDVAIPLLLRYRPIDSEVEARPDLGTGVSVWNSNELSSMDLKFYAASAPYVDPTNAIDSRNGEIIRPAMVFPGDAWAETTNGFASGPLLTVAMVVTVYPDPQARSYLLSSFVSGLPDPDSFPLEVYVEGDQITVRVGTQLASTKIAPGYIGRRPIIFELSINPTECRIAIVSDRAVVKYVNHPKLNNAGLKLYFGRSNDAGTLQMATMDILDLGLDITWTGVERFWSVINRLDSAYGVMK